MKTTAVILSAGSGTRMKSSVNKNLLPLAGKPLLLHTLAVFDQHPMINNIVLVVSESLYDTYQALVAPANLSKLSHIITGGKTRQESCWLGTKDIPAEYLVAVHDAARPLVSHEVIARTIEAAAEYGASLAAVPVKDTLKEVDDNGVVLKTHDRSRFWRAQTPQTVRAGLLRAAHESAMREHFIGTDEASLIERINHPVKVVEGDYYNLKITTPDDMATAERIMARLHGEATPPTQPKPPWLVGLGQDSHRFVPADDPKPLTLGGITVEGCPGLEGNSDADVVLHAIFNALSMAVGGRSIGYYSDPMCLEQGITDSAEYLKVAQQMVREQHYVISNLGISLECKRPRLEAIIPTMKQHIATLLDINVSQIGITATSGEELTDFGRGDGIQALVIVNLMHRGGV